MSQPKTTCKRIAVYDRFCSIIHRFFYVLFEFIYKIIELICINVWLLQNSVVYLYYQRNTK